MTIVGAFDSCNGVLDRPPFTNANGRGNPGCFAPPRRSRALRRRVALISMNHSRSRCPTLSAEDRRRRVAINLTTRSRSRWLVTRAPRRLGPSASSHGAANSCRHAALTASTLKHFVVDARARTNVLAFSCERT